MFEPAEDWDSLRTDVDRIDASENDSLFLTQTLVRALLSIAQSQEILAAAYIAKNLQKRRSLSGKRTPAKKTSKAKRK